VQGVRKKYSKSALFATFLTLFAPFFAFFNTFLSLFYRFLQSASFLIDAFANLQRFSCITCKSELEEQKMGH